MNRKLLDPFEPEYPEAIEACIDDEYATKCSFSHHGSLLATARSDGRCFIWDMDTLTVLRKLDHGEAALMGVSWSRSGRHILTYDEVGVCILWDLYTGAARTRVEFSSAIACARVHPRNACKFVVCPVREAPSLVTAGAEDDDAAPPSVAPIRISGEAVDQKTKAAAATCCCFGKKGVYMFFGTSKGALHAVHSTTLALTCSEKLSGSTLTTVERNPRGTDVVTGSMDRILRVCEVHLPGQDERRPRPAAADEAPSITVTTKIQDIVNRVHWAHAMFSSSGDYIVSGIQHKAEHNIYVWDKLSGSLVKMLTGPNELLEDCAVHPLRPIYASVSTFGIIYMWTRVPQQRWNAFTPGFKELEENIDYVEPEDLFDRRLVLDNGVVVDCERERAEHEKRAGATFDGSEMDVDVDITDNDPLFSDSGSESEDEGFVLPVTVELDSGLSVSEMQSEVRADPSDHSEEPPVDAGRTIVEC
ncbi:chromatin binding protein [Coemansia guatemalensis]|uniref:Chromatin binding protein n=1 Tax=Coemansia guatemalensis TaxID=2761395 RepID=A0A9W8LRS1_9FUNG|nr:chromatin binding protein [Coemansia guatemalensis]